MAHSSRRRQTKVRSRSQEIRTPPRATASQTKVGRISRDEHFDGDVSNNTPCTQDDSCFIDQYVYVVSKEDGTLSSPSRPQTSPCNASSNIAPALSTDPKRSLARFTLPMVLSLSPFNGSPNSPPPPIPTSLSASTCHSPNSSKSPLRRNPLSSAFFVLSVFLCLDLWLKGFAFSSLPLGKNRRFFAFGKIFQITDKPHPISDILRLQAERQPPGSPQPQLAVGVFLRWRFKHESL